MRTVRHARIVLLLILVLQAGISVDPAPLKASDGGVGRSLLFEGNIFVKWDAHLEGSHVHDVIAADIDGDRVPEILVLTSKGLYCLDGSDGQVEWSYSTRAGGYLVHLGELDGDPSYEVLMFLQGTYGGTLISLDATQGRAEWDVDIRSLIGLSDLDGDGRMEAVVRPYEDDARVFSLDLGSGRINWEYRTGNVYDAMIVDLDGGSKEVVVESETYPQNYLYVIDGRSGELKWKKEIGHETRPFQVADLDGDGVKEVLLGTDEVEVLDGKTGKRKDVLRPERSGKVIDILVASGGEVIAVMWSESSGYFISIWAGGKPVRRISFKGEYREGLVVGATDREEVIVVGAKKLMALKMPTGSVAWALEDFSDDLIEEVHALNDSKVTNILVKAGDSLYLVDGRNGSLALSIEGTAHGFGDVSGDGSTDVVFGLHSGNLLLIDGNSLRELWTFTDLLGREVDSVDVGDFDGDGYVEILASQPWKGGMLLHCLDGRDVHLRVDERFDEGPVVAVAHDSNHTLTLRYGNKTAQVPPGEEIVIDLSTGGRIFGNHSMEMQLVKDSFILDSRRVSALIPRPKLTVTYSWEETSLKLTLNFPYPWKFGLKVLEEDRILLEETILPGSVEEELDLSPGKHDIRVVLLYGDEVVAEDELDLELIPEFEISPSGSTITISVSSPVGGSLDVVVNEGDEVVYTGTIPAQGESQIDLNLSQGDHTLTVHLLYDGEELSSKIVKTYVPPSPVPFIAAAAVIASVVLAAFLIRRHREREARELQKILEVVERPVEPLEPTPRAGRESLDDFEVLSVEKPVERSLPEERPAPSMPRRPSTASSLLLEVGGEVRLVVEESRVITPRDLSLSGHGLTGTITLIKQPDGRWSLKVTGTRAVLNGAPVKETFTYLITSGDLLDIWGVRIVLRFQR